MYVPNSVKAFGSSQKEYRVDLGSALPMRNYFYHEVERTKRKYLDNPLERCTNEPRDPNMTACIAEYITDEIGCSMNIQGFQSFNKTHCNTTTQMNAFANISRKLETNAATSVYEMTGCLSSCEKDKYVVSLEEKTDYQLKPASKYRHSDVLVVFTIYARSYVEEEQYIVYDSNSFLADIGGFLGLVLGSSMLNLYDEVVGLLGG